MTSPETESSDREHKIGTDEIKQSDNPGENSQMHGGDSTSGEVENGTSKGGDNKSGVSSTDCGETRQNAGIASTNGDALPSAFSSSDTGENPASPATETGNATSVGTMNSLSEKENILLAEGQRNDAQSEAQEGDEPAPSLKPTLQTKNSDEHDAHDSGTLSASPTGRANSPFGENESPDAQGKKASEKDETFSEIDYRYHSIKKNSGSQVSTSAKMRFGGMTAELKAAKVDRRVVSQARKILSCLVDGGESQDGPRWDWTEFSKRLKTARSVYPARKEEEGRPAILILADVSGSCSGFSDQSLIVAKSVATLGLNGADIIVISHSNGYPIEANVNGKAIGHIAISNNEAASFYDEYLSSFNIQVVIALGDWDAEWLYKELAERRGVKKVVWLDNWSCNNMPEPQKRKDLFEKAGRKDSATWNKPWAFSSPWSVNAQKKVRYVVGCSDASDFVKGIKIGLRE